MKQHDDRCVHTLGIEQAKGQCLHFSGRLNLEDSHVFIFRMTFLCHNLFPFFSPPHTDRKHLNSEMTCTVITHRLCPCICKEPKLCDTPIYQPFAQKGLQDGGKAKQWYPLISAAPKLPCAGDPVSFMASLHKRAAKSHSGG